MIVECDPNSTQLFFISFDYYCCLHNRFIQRFVWRVERKCGKRNEMELKSKTSKRLFDHVLLSVFSTLGRCLACLHFLPLVAPLPSSFLICEVNWHVFIRHHVIKSNLRHPHTLAGRVNRKNASLKCLISYNYLIISRECFHPMINNFFVLERVSILRLASQPPVDVNYAAISNHEQLWIKSVEQLLFRFIESHINYSDNPHGN